MSTLFNFLHQNSHVLVIFVLKISPVINASPLWKISHSGAFITNNTVFVQLMGSLKTLVKSTDVDKFPGIH